MEGNNVLCIDLCLHHISGVDLLIRLITKVSQVMNHRASWCSCKSSIGSLANCRVSEISWLFKKKTSYPMRNAGVVDLLWPRENDLILWLDVCLLIHFVSYKQFRVLLLFWEFFFIVPNGASSWRSWAAGAKCEWWWRLFPQTHNYGTFSLKTSNTLAPILLPEACGITNNHTSLVTMTLCPACLCYFLPLQNYWKNELFCWFCRIKPAFSLTWVFICRQLGFRTWNVV